MNTIDGQIATEWSSDGDGDEAWLELELDQERRLVGFGYRSRMMTQSRRRAHSDAAVPILMPASVTALPAAHLRLMPLGARASGAALRERVLLLDESCLGTADTVAAVVAHVRARR